MKKEMIRKGLVLVMIFSVVGAGIASGNNNSPRKSRDLKNNAENEFDAKPFMTSNGEDCKTKENPGENILQPTANKLLKEGVAEPYIINFSNTHEFCSDVYNIETCGLDSTHFVVFYEDNDDHDYAKLKLGDVSDSIIYFSDAVIVETHHINYKRITALNNTHFVIAYRNESNKGIAKIGNVYNSTINIGIAHPFNISGGMINDIDNLSNSRFVITIDEGHTSKAIVGNVSGDTISFSKKSTICEKYQVRYNKMAVLNDSHFVVAYIHDDPWNSCECRVGVISDDGNITFYNITSFTVHGAVRYVQTLNETHFLFTYIQLVMPDFKNNMRQRIGRVEVNNNITLGNYSCPIDNQYTDDTCILNETHFVAIYNPYPGEIPTVKLGTITGLNITYSSETTFTGYRPIDYDSYSFNQHKFVITYDYPRLDNGTSIIGNVLKNYPPDAPTIIGPMVGIVNEEYNYTLNATDPNGYNITYFIDWEDNNSEWTDYHSSGKGVTVKHNWSENGTYTIRAKAKDVHDAESDWSTLEVIMPKNKPFNFNFNLLECLFKRFPNAFPIFRHLREL